MKIFSLLLVCAALTGCAMRPLKPGLAVVVPGVGAVIQQSENPKTESTQHYERITEDGKTTERVDTKIGAAQKDTAREVAAKLASLRPVMWVGILMFIAGVASAVYPPLRVVVGSVTTSAVCAIAGLALIVLPSLVVGHEILILVAGVGAAAGWFFVHRHGHLRGQLSILKKE